MANIPRLQHQAIREILPNQGASPFHFLSNRIEAVPLEFRLEDSMPVPIHFLGLSKCNLARGPVAAVFGLESPCHQITLEEWAELSECAGGVLLSEASEKERSTPCAARKVELLEVLPESAEHIVCFRRTHLSRVYPLLVTG